MSSPLVQLCSDTPGAKDPTPVALRLAAAGIILSVSLIACSFPSIAKRAPRIEPPLIVFFVGKHFGTGVILSTAFVHLLPEGFESLTDPCLQGKWKDWTGLIVLGSFMAIFLVEYISTVYVERISPANLSDRHSKMILDHEHDEHYTPIPYHDDPDAEASSDADFQRSGQDSPSEPEHVDQGIPNRSRARHSRVPSGQSYLRHHRYESPSSRHHQSGPRLTSGRQSLAISISEAEELSRTLDSHAHGHGAHSHGLDAVQGEASQGKRIISILVLQLGIMLHSLVIGLTLSITAGADFSTLLTAVIFHQLFEGLSLGIRISTLPSGSRATRLLPVILCTLFAVTTPVGVLLGMVFLPSASSSILQPGGTSAAQTALLTKGLMCALSAGMLIYAAAVEMLAGDFVMDPEMRQFGLWKQALGLGSLILGIIAMAIVG